MTMTPDRAKEWAVAPALDYKAIGFRCGLEIHQQLDTGKLFSRVPSQVVDGEEELRRRTIGSVLRTLRATGGETGELDAAAAAESRRNRSFRYLAIDGLTSLVELDEEPPKPLDGGAHAVGLTLLGLLHSRPVDEVHVMRKTVIDGSNTGGFQRTALIGTGGQLDVEGGAVGVWTVALEEDSARPLREEAGVATYTLDRLGIPLVEIATAPDVVDPQHAQRTAARIGALLRSTGRVKRGLGTIRQDLNVSVAVGERVEIKGCQDLRAVARVIEQECRRQLWMHHVAGQLKARGFDASTVGAAFDASPALAASEAKLVKDALGKGQKALGLRLPKAAGLLRGASKEGPRLGRELADHAKVAAGVKGIFHSDELPAYGITQAEVDAVRALLRCGPEDGFALCLERPDVARRALDAVAERLRLAVAGPQREVRGAQPDDSTRFLRPMPGAARMYPETDVPPIRLDLQLWRRTLENLPAKPEQRVAALVKQHGLSQDAAQQVVGEGLEPEFAALAAGAGGNLAARILLQYLPTLANAEAVHAQLPALVAALRAGRFAKEALPDLLKALDADPKLTAEAAIAKAGVGSADAAAVDAVIAAVIAERADFVKSRGMAAMGPLMGPVMAQLRGKADGALISERLKAAIERAAR
ncbi:MAG: glutamyl-tRNA(Gln) amidotransferase subunit [Thermoplasmata archaeon]|jgi:glutamyl-tRNA(Gln) amidotransferase subunit E|nr:glutamyl-tRNA(Gln) amidotransferase subunit [Thermoplasmata archaeon]